MTQIIGLQIIASKHHVQVADYKGLRESGPLKIGEEGDGDVIEDDDVDEDDRHDDGFLGDTPAPPGEKGREAL